MNKKTLLILISIFVTILIIFSLVKPSKNTNIKEDKQTIPEQTLLEEDTQEKEESKSKGPVSIEMISPEEETFVSGQARFWKGQITNKPENTRTYCNWKFYISLTDEDEYLYKEQTSRAGGDWCGFTSTFIQEKGKLRVELDLVDIDEDTEESTLLTSTKREFLVK